MTRRQIAILIILGICACATLALVSFLYLNSALSSISNSSSDPITPFVPTTKVSLVTSTDLPTILPPIVTQPILLTQTPIAETSLEDGIYLVENSRSYHRIPIVTNDVVLEISTMPSTSNNKPVFAIKGDQFQIEEIKLRGYYAGVGIHTELISLGSGNMGAKIIQIFENSPASEAGLNPEEIIFGINGEPFRALELNYALPPYRDLVGLYNPNQTEITIDVLSGTTERSVTLSRTFRLSGDNFKTNQAISSLTIEPNGEHVLLKVTWPLKPGVYRLEFEQDKTQKWIFVVR